MSDWFKRVFLGIAIFGMLAAAPAQAQNGRGQGHGAGASAKVVQLRPTGVVHGQYIVVLRDDVGDPRAVANALARAHGLGLGLVYSSALKGFSASIPERALGALARDPRVDYIEADQWVQAFAQTVPFGVERIFADDNGNITINGSDDYRVDVDVAVIDTGIDLDHPDLNVVGSTNCAKGGPFGGDCKDGDGNDGNGHGSHVAGTIGAIDNDIGVVGVAPGARLWAVRVLDNNGSGWMSWIVGGIDWVTANADIIEVANMSLGCECSSSALDTAISNSVAAGVVYAVAAGNSNKDASTFSPANHPDVITVSALADFDGVPGGLGSPTCRTDQDDTGADFSNWGSLIEVAAPGVCIYSTWKNGGTNTISGTSMASPHVAGAAALLAATNTMLTPAQILNTLIAEGNSNWSDDSGDGIQEPLLDVSNTGVFAPATVAGDGGGGTPVDSSPSVSWLSPSGGTVSGTVAIQIEATDSEDAAGSLDVEWRVKDSGDSWAPTTYNGAGYYEGLSGWDTTMVSDGNVTLEAQATDSGSNVTPAEVTVTVDNVPDPAPAGVAAADVGYATEGGKNQDKHLLITVTAKDSGGIPVSGASVSVVVDFDSNADPDTDPDATRNGSGTTGADGTVTFSWKNAPSNGCYWTDVTADNAALDPSVVQDGDSDTGFCK